MTVPFQRDLRSPRSGPRDLLGGTYPRNVCPCKGWRSSACSASSPAAGRIPTPFDPAEYGKLAGLKASGNLQLRDELARITDEGGTPEQLSRNDVPDDDNAAVVLRAVFPPHKAKSLWEASEKIYPPRAFAFDPIRLQKAIDFRTRHEAERRKAQEAVSRPKCTSPSVTTGAITPT